MTALTMDGTQGETPNMIYKKNIIMYIYRYE